MRARARRALAGGRGALIHSAPVRSVADRPDEPSREPSLLKSTGPRWGPLPSSHTVQAAVFTLVFVLCAYFYNGYGWGQTARYDPIWAFVEQGPDQYTLRIDGFLSDPEEGLNTGDWARNPERGDHYYSNKAPGTSLLGIPFYLALYHAERAAGLDPTSVRGVLVNAYLINLWVSVLPVALSAVFFFGLARTLTGSERRALGLTFILYGGTLMFPFSTMLWGHATAAALVVMSLAAFVGSGPRRLFWSGLFAGLAVLTDYGAAPLPALLVAAAAVSGDRRPKLAALALGGLAPAVAFAAYHWTLFGSPLTLASSHSPPGMLRESEIGGLFGSLQPGAFGGLTISTRRGLFFFMPVLLMSLGVAAHMLRRTDGRLRSVREPAGPARPPDHQALAWIAIGCAALIFLSNLSFNGWHGGVTAGPRYQIVALPFYVVLLAFLPERAWMGYALLLLACVSFANMFVIAAVSPMAPDALRGSPLLFAYAKLIGTLRLDLGLDPPLPAGGSLSRGSIHVYPTFLMRAWTVELTSPVIERLAVFNLGERVLGLRGAASLLPALLIPAGLGTWLWRRTGRGRSR